MKKSILFFPILLCAWAAFAEHIPFSAARQVAANWVGALHSDFKDNVALGEGETLVRDGAVVAYVFHFVPSGFVLVAAEDYLPPVKLYSLKNDFGGEGRLLEEQVVGDLSSLIRKVNAKSIDPEKYFAGNNRDNFAMLRLERHQEQALSAPFPVQDATPLLHTTWNQGEPYNLLCPLINNRRPPSGCVATAFAQIFFYFQYPASGQGSHSYTWRNATLTADFNHAYDWGQMLPDYQATPGTAGQRSAVAQLMYDLGVAFEMDYNLLGSGAYADEALTVLPLYFKYSNDIKVIYRSEVNSDEEWFEIARKQLDSGLPVAFSIYTEDTGHEVVIDGYRVSAGASSFHINMGWGGSYDAYYSLNNILDFNVSEWQILVYDIYPPGFQAVQPPQNPAGEAFLNESLFFSQYYCRISWEASPSGDETLRRYVVLQKDGQGNVTSLGEVAPQVKEFTFRNTDYAAASYAVVAVDKNDRQSMAKFFSLLRR
jgi:hypothetical protein